MKTIRERGRERGEERRGNGEKKRKKDKEESRRNEGCRREQVREREKNRGKRRRSKLFISKVYADYHHGPKRDTGTLLSCQGFSLCNSTPPHNRALLSLGWNNVVILEIENSCETTMHQG